MSTSTTPGSASVEVSPKSCKQSAQELATPKKYVFFFLVSMVGRILDDFELGVGHVFHRLFEFSVFFMGPSASTNWTIASG